MPGKLSITHSSKLPNDPQIVRAYCEGRQFAKDGKSLVYASGVTGVVLDNNAIKWTAKIPGNGYEVNLVNAGESQQLSVSIGSGKIYVNLATDSSGVVTSTAAEVISTITANSAASEVIGAANEGASTGAGIPTVQGVTLTGSNFGQIVSDAGVAFAAGVASWTADPTGVVTQDCCALPYGGGHA